MWSVDWNEKGKEIYQDFPPLYPENNLVKLKEVLCGTYYCYEHGSLVFSTMGGFSTVVGTIEKT